MLKPLHGDEILSEVALESFFLQDYPDYQLVFGVQSQDDPVLPLIGRLRKRHPGRDVALMVNDTPHGRNRKIANLINMRPLARHELLVISDADVHVPPHFLSDVVATLEMPGVGLVTSLYTGLPGNRDLPALLGAMQINQGFLPGVLLARQLGRQDCLGATMAIRKSLLTRIGGLEALADHLADDQLLGRKVLAAGERVALAPVIPATTVPEESFASLFSHELRWARTIRALEPLGFAASVLQIPLLWAALTLVFSGFGLWSLALFLLVWAARVVLGWRIEAALRIARTREIWLYLLRDFFSTIIYIAGFMGNRVVWRGQSMAADKGHPAPGSRE
ncbi:bacteriohopanetetrol glucosamine biosynthesis glycosyltransferase HpnI [Acidocella sp. MX-AZ03]|uniref:bacteriohopanetetrol glucosamine biosynthesis glycosyltransferase HpnI n=1 Tax=Acidocella sp. MX-AZ03 TaxID=2697363 RepID=UPI0022DD4C03|nr:bacteriohopanetetrol glucosamine biosynthesis glycosyltransferase HpnI [Acidocella sp. MX-AZ03]WBO60108.1 bacteriohopanetetrol glucosamine biosynthesis glycosyltransferase HpnI [Acidocella sp. MX-AZ03]